MTSVLAILVPLPPANHPTATPSFTRILTTNFTIMSTYIDPEFGSADDHRRQLIIVVSGNASPEIAECLAFEVGTNYIGGATILRDLEESTNKAEVRRHPAQLVDRKEDIDKQ